MNDSTRRKAEARLRIELDAEECRRSLSTFTERSWPIIEPGTPFKSNYHLDCINEHLEAVTHGQIKRLLINMPPRYGKTGSVSIAWPTWEWTRNTPERWIFTSYAASLSHDASLKRRQILESDWYRERWPGVELARDRNERGEYHNTDRGVMIATSRDGALTGKGGNRIVIDDLQNPRLAFSQAEREAALRYFNGTLPSRINDAERGAMVCVMQRLHEQDIAARCKELGWTTLILPGRFPRRTTITFPRSGRTITKEQGDCLWPERQGPADHDALKAQLGAFEYAAQYDQEPAPATGGLFKRTNFRYWRPGPTPDVIELTRREGSKSIVALAHCRIFMTVDLATSTSQLADFTVISTWAVTPGSDLVLLDRIRDRIEAPEAIRIIAEEYARHGASYVAVDSQGMQLSYVQHLRDKGLAVRGLRSDKDKTSRSLTAQVRVEAGQVYFPALADWLPEWETELLRFPRGHDDQLDTLSSAALEVFTDGAPPPSPEAAQAEAEAEAEKVREAAEEKHQARREDPDDDLWWGQ